MDARARWCVFQGMGILAIIAFLFSLSMAEPATAPAGPAPAAASLDLQVDLPAQLAREAVTVELRRLPGKQLVERRELESGDGLHRFENIPPGALEVELQTSIGPFPKIIELEAGQDGFLAMAPELLVVWGTVYQDDEGVPARLSFTTVKRTRVETVTDEYGAYEIASLDPLGAASVRLGREETRAGRGSREDVDGDEEGGGEEGGEAEREPLDYLKVFWQKVDTPRQIDFHLPDVRIAARVVDAETGVGIEGATVVWSNRFLPEGQTDPSKDERSGTSVATDEDGFAEPPLARPGTVTLEARAEGYLPSGEPLVIQVAEGEPDRTVQLDLQPAGEPVDLRLTLPSGEPAVGAQALVVSDLATGRSLAHGTADASGRMTLSRAPTDAFLVVRHPAAAIAIRPWPAAGSPGPSPGGAVTLSLPAAGPPLTLRVMDPSGETPARRATVAVWVQGYRLTGARLAFAIDGHPLTDLQGFMVLEGLPRGPVRVLAWERGAHAQGVAGELDALAHEIPFPWPAQVEIPVVR